MDADTEAAAGIFKRRRLVSVLEAAPAADVIDQDDIEAGGSAFDLADQALQFIPSVQRSPLLP